MVKYMRVVPRTISKYQLRRYFGVTKHRFPKLVTPEIREKMGISPEQDRKIHEYNVAQTKILVQELSLSDQELVEIGKIN